MKSERSPTFRPSNHHVGSSIVSVTCLKQFALTGLLVLSFFSCVSASAVSIPTIPTARQTVDGDGYGGEGYTVLPLLSDEPQATAIIIHGLGGTGQEWGVISLALSFFSLNYVKFIIPSAPVQPVTYLDENMPSWFDISRLTRNSANVDRDQLLSSMDRIHAIIRGEVRSGVEAERIFIIGFSQGGALALTSFLRSRWKIGGCVGVATWLPLHTEYPQARSSKIENKDILMLHVSHLIRQDSERHPKHRFDVRCLFIEKFPTNNVLFVPV